LRKPSVSAWAVNQAVRRSPQEAKALVKAGDELRKAQRGVVSGRDPAQLREANSAHRRLVEELTDEARAALEERGAATAVTVTRVAQTLRAASIDKEASKALTAGTLAEDVEQAGFGPLLTAVPSGARSRPGRAAKPAPKAKPKPKPPPKPKPNPNAAKRKRLEEELAKAQARVRELEERLEALK
jgi:type IV secretory pathway VirB10-like protein